MRRVICVITLLFVFSILYGCKKSEKLPEFKLPEKIEHPEPGAVSYITPKALVDSINSGAKLRMFYIYENMSMNQEYMVPVPGLINILVSDMFYAAETLSTEEPLYLLCTWGDDSKKVANMLAVEGFDSYYLDGGTYRLMKEQKKNGWVFQPRTTKTNR
ncbi:hypothetical protein K9N50_13245 [bacterium]|nr:hypothetical protein [bacterium]